MKIYAYIYICVYNIYIYAYMYRHGLVPFPATVAPPASGHCHSLIVEASRSTSSMSIKPIKTSQDESSRKCLFGKHTGTLRE